MIIDSDERKQVIPALMHPGTLATVLYAIALRYCGPEIHDWEPETVFLELKDELGVEMPPGNHDKLQALLSAISGNAFYVQPLAFLAVCQSLSGSENPLDMDDPLLPAEMAWGVLEVQLNDDTPALFDADVAELVANVLEEDGFTSPPEMLAFAKLSKVYSGSTYAADLKQERLESSEHEQVVKEYVRDQGLLLFRQLQALPWHTPDTLQELARMLPKRVAESPDGMLA